jgi:hypothetical protein
VVHATESRHASGGELLCRQEPLYGTGTGEDFEEEGYVSIPPCVFGSAAEGLPAPPGGERGLPFGTRLFSKKAGADRRGTPGVPSP